MRPRSQERVASLRAGDRVVTKFPYAPLYFVLAIDEDEGVVYDPGSTSAELRVLPAARVELDRKASDEERVEVLRETAKRPLPDPLGVLARIQLRTLQRASAGGAP